MNRSFRGVPIFNPKTPRKYPVGGFIKADPRMTPQQRKNDSVHIIAMPGELIIPYYKKGFKDGELVDKVIGYLDRIGVKLPGT